MDSCACKRYIAVADGDIFPLGSRAGIINIRQRIAHIECAILHCGRALWNFDSPQIGAGRKGGIAYRRHSIGNRDRIQIKAVKECIAADIRCRRHIDAVQSITVGKGILAYALYAIGQSSGFDIPQPPECVIADAHHAVADLDRCYRISHVVPRGGLAPAVVVHSSRAGDGQDAVNKCPCDTIAAAAACGLRFIGHRAYRQQREDKAACKQQAQQSLVHSSLLYPLLLHLSACRLSRHYHIKLAIKFQRFRKKTSTKNSARF